MNAAAPAGVPGWSAELLTFAMDHRNSFRKLLGLPDQPSAAQQAAAAEVKAVVFDGFAAAVDMLGPSGLACLLDEEYGAPLAARAHALGARVIAPVERSGQAELSLEYDDALPRLVDTLQADLLKVLLRYNAGGDAERNARQAETLARLSDWCLTQGVPLMAEVLVPMTDAQRADYADRPQEWEQRRRPELMVTAMRQLRAAGADPVMWKVEGLDDPGAAREVVEVARAEGRPDVSCVVLGRGESLARVEDWLRVGAATDGYVGFAVGRSLWNDEALAVHTEALTRAAAAESSRDKYVQLVNTWRTAQGSRDR